LAPRADKSARVPQTPAQQGLWLIDHNDPGNVAYNIPEAFLVNRAMDANVLQEAVNRLLMRHEILRTSFHEDDGELFQSIEPEAEAVAGLTDLSALPEEDREKTLRQAIREQARRPFDLRQQPLVRFELYRLSERQHVLFFNIHHIIADRQSLDILLDELIRLYEAVVKNEPADLPAVSLHFADYAVWLAKEMDSAATEKQIRYWKRKLAGAPPFIDLPHSRPYPAKRTSWGATMPVTIPGSLRESLSKIGNAEGASPFMTFLAGFAFLVYLYAGSEDFCIGSPITHRRHVATERMVGLFVNMLAFRCQMTPEQSFREVARKIRNTALEAYDNSDVPFQKIVRAMKPDRRFQRSPIFQVMFGFESRAQNTGSVLQIDTAPGTARYDLTLNLTDHGGEATGTIEYCTDIFEAADIEKLLRGMAILDEAAREPDRPISELVLPD